MTKRDDPANGGPLADLTPSERRIAELVSEGMTNNEVASALALSAKTVEAHLGRVYRKLGLRSRTELTRFVITAQRR
jgi:DNA-binding NarL/FixJ family response regulator